MPHFTVMMMNVFIIALLIVFCQVIDARITNLAQNTTSNTPNLEAETAMSDEGATLIGGKTLVFENDEIKKQVSHNSFSIIETDKAKRTPIIDDSKNDLEKATIIATDTPMSGGAAFVRDEVLVFENDGIEKASNYNLLSNIDINKVAAPFEDDSKTTALFIDDYMNESLKKATIMVPDEKAPTKLEDSRNDSIEKGNIMAADEAETVIHKLQQCTIAVQTATYGTRCNKGKHFPDVAASLKKHAIVERRHALILLIIPSLVIHVHLLERGMIIAINAVMIYTLVSSKARQVERILQCAVIVLHL